MGHNFRACGVVHHLLVVGKVEVGQEPERAEREGEYGRHDALEEPRREEHGAVTAKLQAK